MSCPGCDRIALMWLSKTQPPREGDRATCLVCGVEKMVTSTKYNRVACCVVEKKKLRWNK